MADVMIAGIGATKYAKTLAESPWELALSAALSAIDDAGLDPKDIDGICRFAGPLEYVNIPMMVRGLGIKELTYFADFPLGGEASGLVVAAAANAIAANQAKAVLVYRSLSQSSGGRYGRADQMGPAGGVTGAEDIVIDEIENANFAFPYGLVTPAQHFAIQATRYMHERAVTFDQMEHALGTVAITQRAYANNNPRAIMREKKLDRNAYNAARMISWPLRLYDLCVENDGAVALLLTSADLVKSSSKVPVRVLAATQSLTPYGEPLGMFAEDIVRGFPPEASQRLYTQAGVTADRIRVAELYDAFSIMVLTTLDGYGLCDRPAWRYLSEVGIGLDSPLPINTHGGHLSEGYLHGMNGYYEAVEQLRGTAANQVIGADVALVGAPLGSAAILAVA